MNFTDQLSSIQKILKLSFHKFTTLISSDTYVFITFFQHISNVI